MHQVNGRHIAICELSLAATYAKHGNWRLVRECAMAAKTACNLHQDNAELHAEADAYLMQSALKIGG